MQLRKTLAAGCLLVLLGGACQAPEATVANEVRIRDARVAVEVVDTPETQRKGLGYRDRLDWNQGMLFTYSHPRMVPIWMKGMRFDIDIIWLRDGRIIDMHWRAPHKVEGSLPTYVPREVADMVLEVPAGYAEAHGWRAGDEAHIRLEKNPAP